MKKLYTIHHVRSRWWLAQTSNASKNALRVESLSNFDPFQAEISVRSSCRHPSTGGKFAHTVEVSCNGGTPSFSSISGWEFPLKNYPFEGTPMTSWKPPNIFIEASELPHWLVVIRRVASGRPFRHVSSDCKQRRNRSAWYVPNISSTTGTLSDLSAARLEIYVITMVFTSHPSSSSTDWKQSNGLKQQLLSSETSGFPWGFPPWISPGWAQLLMLSVTVLTTRPFFRTCHGSIPLISTMIRPCSMNKSP